MEKRKSPSEKWVDNIHAYESGMPADAWEGIQARRKKKNKRGIIWLSLLAGIVVAAAGVWWFLASDLESADELPEVHASNDSKKAASLSNKIEKEVTSSPLMEEEKTIKSQNRPQNNKSEATLVKNGGVVQTTTLEKTNQKSFGREVDIPNEPENHKPEQSEVKVSAAHGHTVSLASLPGLEIPYILSNISQDLPAAPDPCFKFSEKSFKLAGFYVELLGGLDLPFKSLKEVDPTEDLGYYREARDTSEQDWYAFSAQLGLGMQYENGLSIRTGLHYLQINEIFEFADASITRTVLVEIKDSNGNVIGTQTVIEEGYRYVKTHNRLRFLDLPIQLGWEKRKGDFSFGIYGGATINLLFKQKGAFFSKDLEPVGFSSSTEDPYAYFKAKAGLTATANLSLGYHLSDNLSWRLEPQFRYQLAPLNTTLLEQRYSTVGLWTGLRYNF